jgi:CBS domain-containing protein
VRRAAPHAARLFSDLLPPTPPDTAERGACYSSRLMKVREIMTPAVQCVRPEDNLVEAAGVMRELDVGAVPVCDRGEVIGIVTDRDITVRATAEGRDPNRTFVHQVMSPGVVFAYEDDTVESVVQLMEENQVRRAPVLTRQKKLAGIVSLGDLAVDANTQLSAEALREVSRPATPVR